VIKPWPSGKSFADATARRNIKIAATSQRSTATRCAIPPSRSWRALPLPPVKATSSWRRTARVELLVAQVEKVLREAPARNPPALVSRRGKAADKMASDDFLVAMQNAALAPPREDERQLVDQTLGIGKEADPAEPVIEIEPSRVEFEARTARARRTFVDEADQRSGNARYGAVEARRGTAGIVPVRERGGKRLARPLFVIGLKPMSDLAGHGRAEKSPRG